MITAQALHAMTRQPKVIEAIVNRVERKMIEAAKVRHELALDVSINEVGCPEHLATVVVREFREAGYEVQAVTRDGKVHLCISWVNGATEPVSRKHPTQLAQDDEDARRRGDPIARREPIPLTRSVEDAGRRIAAALSLPEARVSRYPIDAQITAAVAER